MKIIGHRGVAGLALENTLSGIELGRILGVDLIEVDVRKTKDNKLVLCHDSDLSRISTHPQKVSDMTLSDLKKIILNDGQSRIPTLEEAIKIAGNTPMIIELKVTNCAREIADMLITHPDSNVWFASFMHSELTELKSHGVTCPLIALEATRPFDIIHFAKRGNFNGIGIKFWLLNPLTYFLARRSNLSIYVYTVNNRLIGLLIQKLYPFVDICTDRPELFIKHPWIKIRKSFRR